MIDVKNITKIFNENTNQEFTALKDISFSVNSGDIFFLKGISGSGKSTLLAIMAGLYKPTFGEIIMNNESISKLSLKFASAFRRKNIGMIFQNFNLIPTFNVIDNILIPTVVDKTNKVEYAKELLSKFDLINKENLLVKNLSGGEQQRVAIIRALINNPTIILADEPTANLDKALSIKLFEYFEDMKKDGKTIIISTHDPFLLESDIADGFFELKKGE
ncbi:ABC transporter, ATP-binding protein [Campylobacter blaseri]|uniref:ABC transporter ATP-binding protein n=1 Tax=Campylobacter blaseri TaxID=2042961 RepID=A0A2P8R0G4_9BACT|nr:ABC transporter ATP-binding protein [Campylobacter blaseri]PSM51986.1 ABC transporter ATP-binding protein [Campylobacter blaseri]PSM53771.1 ABC transporter ATP-binding protein [Campylobacter blaseri]QKF85675.1 ABC transporter, ATP-binding protein [Campylobacter blaseri]